MAIPTSRTKVKGEISIDHEKCTVCGACIEVCKDFSIEIVNDRLQVSANPCFGCIACGHCMAVCPTGAIQINGRFLSPDDLIQLPAKEAASNYDQLLALLNRRRSVREFEERPVSRDTIDTIIKAALTAPMGLPPSDVNLLVFEGKDKVRAFAEDYCRFLKSIKWMVSPWFLTLMRPFWGKSMDELFRGFVKPLFDVYTVNMDKGVNHVTYDAPLAMYFYGSPYCDPADPIITATYAMLAAETLGLGTCMLGGIHPMIQSGKKAKLFRERHGIKYKSREGLFVIFGYSKVNYLKGINRTFASVEYHP